MAGSKSETAHNLEEDRLTLALVVRGLVTREEVLQCKPKPGAPTGSDALLQRLVQAGCLTAPQSKRAAQELANLVGQQIPGYQLMEKLGQGSMGAVYKARQVSMNRLVAIKVMLPRLAADPEFLERFIHEAHLAARLSHNNIVQAIDVGSAGKLHYFVMEYIEGTNIRQQITSGKVYEEQEALEIVLQIARALDHAFQRKLVHRDVKPANILLTPDGTAKLADLGLARETTAEARSQQDKGVTAGTPYYMAPEQILGEPDVDVRADLYSLGATCYHMVTGRPPYPGKNAEELFKQHLHDKLAPPDQVNPKLSAGLSKVIECMMAKDRRRRYASPRDLIFDLDSLLIGEPPRLAQAKRTVDTLADLTEGEEQEAEYEEVDEVEEPRGVPVLWVVALGALLALSFILNIILLALRR